MLDEITAEIKRLLELDPKYRDNDRLLCARIWFNEIQKDKTMTAEKFLFMYAFEKSLTTADTISRLRRIVQAENPHLETEKSKARKLKAKEVKEFLKETDFSIGD